MEEGGNWKVRKVDVKAWFGEEKLPEGYVKPAKAISLSEAGALSSAIQKMAQAVVVTGKVRRGLEFVG
jgi:hypothetical protein